MPYADPEVKRAYNRAYYERHREKLMAYLKAYRASNREKVLATERAYAATHREERRAANRARDIGAYTSWRAMRTRCLNSKAENYPRYGGLGVTVTERWNSFANFLADMGERPIGTTLDRVDPTGNYEKVNCRWTDTRTQRLNRRAA